MPVHPLTQFRENHGLTKTELARRIGVSKTTVMRWEKGSRNVELDLLQRVSKATGISARLLRPDLAEAID
jgi:transcriptional regulator with XRE-family HTH domain